jgi:crotonobetainyl-CoA:carnitine CoA-transferase CaiB-like acyl-CoA transferase
MQATRKPSTGPLQGIKILDLTRLLPGPLGAMMMADMGAEVIKIESPNFKDYARNFPPFLNKEAATYLAFNRSKRSLVIDYKKEEGKAILLELVKTADIVMEQFRPGVMDRMGLGYEDLKKVNPKIIYVSITGYGQTGPYRDKAGHDLNYISYAGVLGITGERNGAPVIPGIQTADIAGGSYMSVIACLAALQARHTTGVGQFVDVSMMDSVMPLTVTTHATFAATNQPQPRGSLFLSGGLANYNVYPCQDGKYIALGTLEPQFWMKFCQVTGKTEWLNKIAPTSEEAVQALYAEVKAFFETQPQQYWLDLSDQHDLLISPVYDMHEVEQDPQVQAREMIVEQEHPTAGKVKTIGVPLKFSETKATPAWASPVFGADTQAILREAGYSEEQIEQWMKDKLIVG